ncbi:MAG TPA: DUF5668 domain-containing protein [Vicinamibacterales bacterium]
MDPKESSPRSLRFGIVVAGLILLALGATVLLDPSGVTWFHTAPLVLIALGASMLLDRTGGPDSVPDADVNSRGRSSSCARTNYTAGLWLIGIGAWMLVSQNHLWGLSFATSWPLLLVLMGAVIVIRGWH